MLKIISQLIRTLGFMITIITFFGCFLNKNPLQDKLVCIDAGHGGTAGIDSFRIGPSGEREEWINLRVALMLKEMLEDKNSRVLMTRSKDIAVSLQDRAQMAVEKGADVFISIHHNATADPTINFPIVYFHGSASENQASVLLGKCVAKSLRETLFDDQTPASLVSDLTIFPNSGTAILHHSYGIPGIIGESSFFTHPQEEQRLKQEGYNLKEAKAYLSALERFFSFKTLPIKERRSKNKIKPFPVLQEAARLNPVALLWKQDYVRGCELATSTSMDSLEKALYLLTRSAQSFPDSWLAADAHLYRARILEKMTKNSKAEMERKRVAEFYVDIR